MDERMRDGEIRINSLSHIRGKSFYNEVSLVIIYLYIAFI